MKVPHASLACPSDNSRIKMNMSVEYWWTDTNGGETEEFEEKPIPMSLCPSQKPYGPVRNRMPTSAVKSRQLTANQKEGSLNDT